MNVQRHARIEQIRKLSEYLRRALRCAEGVLWLGWPLVLILPLVSATWTGKAEGVPLSHRLGLAVFAGVTLLFTQLAVRYCRLLMAHFAEGRIFDAGALHMARKAIQCGLILLVLRVGAEIASGFYTGKFTLPGPFMTMFYGFLFFGLLHVMLWSLEIGRDLHDESELTI
ncbi:MAG: hypothetical protein V4633_01705 [Pseudomonadota bacterium]